MSDDVKKRRRERYEVRDDVEAAEAGSRLWIATGNPFTHAPVRLPPE